MRPDQFKPDKPGNLVPTVFEEEVAGGRLGETRKSKGYAFEPRDLPPKISIAELYEQILDELILAETSLARLEGASDELPNAKILWAPLSRREAILSSKIEDTVASAEELVLIESGEKPEREEAQEVANYVAALNFGLHSELPICNRLILQMHEILLGRGVRGAEKRPGEFRTIQNYIGKKELGFTHARFVPPPPGDSLNRCMKAWERFVNDTESQLRPLIAIAMGHYQFECIHPFRDGNGRIGRLIVALSLCKNGLLTKPMVYVSGYFDAHREEYYRLLLAVSTDNAWPEWIKFFLRAVANQADDALLRIRRLRVIRKKYRGFLVDANAPAKSTLLVDRLLERPVVHTAAVAKILGVSRPTARSYIHKLVDCGALVEISGGYRQKWIAHEVVQVIEN